MGTGKKARCARSRARVVFSRDNAGLSATLPEQQPDEYAYTLKVTPRQA